RRTGAVDRADEQVEALFKPQYQTSNSPIHKAVWDGKAPLDLFVAPAAPAAASAAYDKVMNDSLDVVGRHKDAGTLLDEKGKTAVGVLEDLGRVGYWGLLIDPKYGGTGAPFQRFTHFLTRMATLDPMVAGLASIHGCIGAVDPVRTFGTAEQKARFL